jgi:SSS family solute:Na+ symporter
MEPDSVRQIDLVVIVIYLGLMLGIGLAFSRFMKGGKEFFIGGNHIPWWAAGISLYMTTFSAWMFTGAASFVYNTGWFGILFFVVKPLGFLAGFLLSARRWRRSRVTSPVEYVRTRFNRPTHLFLSIMMILSMMYWPGHHLASLAKICAPTLFPNMPAAIDIMIIVAGIFILIYTISGGFWAVCVTDVVQFIILFAICLVLIPVIFLSGDVGSPVAFIQALPPLEFDHLVRGNTVYNEYYLIGFMVAGVFGNMVGDKAQRFYSVRDEKAAMKVGWLGFGLFLTSPILFGIPPLVGLVLFPDLSELAYFSNITKPDENIFIAVVMKYLPVGMVGIFLSAMMAASMSALDSVWNTVSSIVSVDIYKGIFKPDASEKQVLLAGRLTILVLSVIAVVMALLIIHSDLGLFTISNIVLGLFGIPVTIPMVAGLWSRDISRWSAIASIAAGVFVATSIRFHLGYSLGVQYLATIAVGLLFLYSSYPIGRLSLKSRSGAIAVSLIAGLASFGVYLLLGQALDAGGIIWPLAAGIGCASLLAGFSHLYARDLASDQSQVDHFFTKLATPVNTEAELEAEGADVASSYSWVGMVTMIMGGLCLIILPLAESALDVGATLGVSFLLLVFGGAMYRLRPGKNPS